MPCVVISLIEVSSYFAVDNASGASEDDATVTSLVGTTAGTAATTAAALASATPVMTIGRVRDAIADSPCWCGFAQVVTNSMLC